MAPEPIPAWLVDTAQHHLAQGSTDPDGFSGRLKALQGALNALEDDMGPLGAPGALAGRTAVAQAALLVGVALERLDHAAQLLLAEAGLPSSP